MTQNRDLITFLKTPAAEIFNEKFCLWSSFLLLTGALASFSYFTLTPSAEIWIIFIGFGLPAGLLILVFKKEKNKFFAVTGGETIPFFSPWVFFLLGILAVGLRFYKLTTLSHWPLRDEGIFGYYAVHLSETWNGSLTQGLNHLPTPFTWVHAVLFKLFGSSLLTLWVYPAFWSLLILPAGWFAARQFFPRSMSLLVLAFAAFSFWPLWLGRFSTQAVFLVFWECAALGALGWYLKDSTEAKTKKLIFLGVISGLGFYTYLPWAAVALIIGLAVLDGSLKNPRERFTAPLIFLTFTLLIALPLFASFSAGKLSYLEHLWGVRSNFTLTSRLNLYSAYFSDFFWGARNTTFHYGPLWGGFLNPLWGALFFIGLIFLFRSISDSKSRWFLISLPILCLPGFLTNDLEDMRLVPMIPILAVITGLGFQTLILSLPWFKRLPFLFLILSTVLSLDGYHLFVVYPVHWPENYNFFSFHKSVKYSRAYDILKERYEKEGPGLILQNFDPDYYDQTLFVATYSFNSAENPLLNPGTAKWFAVITNIHEQPHLVKIFHEGRWAWLSAGLNRRDGGYMLLMVPITAQNRKLVYKWMDADLALKDLNYLVMEEGVNPDQTNMLAVLKKAYPYFEGDRLLESRFWRIKALHDNVAQNIDASLEDEEKAVQKGYPMAHLFNEKGCLLYKEKRVEEAKKAFEEALRLKPNCTDAAINLRNLLILSGKKIQ